MTVRTRFAPSPTGFLHIGGARTALYNWLFARRHGGKFLLRVEDTDAERSTAASMEVILNGLRWLGLDWDEGPGVGGPHAPYAQSERRAIYDAYLAKLEAAGLVYDDEGAIRFRVPDRVITVHDLVCGEVSVNLKEQGSRRYDAETKQEVEANPDLVIRRPNGGYIFHFVNVVDDLEMGITHVIRGEDHLSNTPKHLALFEAFGATPPIFAHIPLNLNPSGTKMSKRDQGALIHEYQENGFLPEAVNNYMALLGWSGKDDQEIFSVAELRERFDLDGVNNSNSKFDFDKIRWVNGEHLRALTPDALASAAAPFLAKAGIDPEDVRVGQALVLAKDRVVTLAEIPGIIVTIFEESVTYDEASLAKVREREDLGVVVDALAKHLAGATPWSVDGIKAAIGEAATSLGLKMGALMLPCRVVVTGSTAGADLVPMMELIGRVEVLRRLVAFEAV
jgi:glutamyl-tRNA synthetase